MTCPDESSRIDTDISEFADILMPQDGSAQPVVVGVEQYPVYSAILGISRINGDVGQSSALIECILINFRDACGNGYSCQGGTGFECLAANGSHRFTVNKAWNLNRSIYGCFTSGNRDRYSAIDILKRLVGWCVEQKAQNTTQNGRDQQPYFE